MISQRDMRRRRMNRTHSMWTEDLLRRMQHPASSSPMCASYRPTRAVFRLAGQEWRPTMTETPLKVVKSEPAPSTDAERRPGYRSPVAGSGAGGRAHRYKLADDTRRQAEGLFPGSPGSRLPPPHRNLRPQDRGPDRDVVLHSGAEDARAVGGGPALRSRHLHLPRRLSAAVADHVSA